MWGLSWVVLLVALVGIFLLAFGSHTVTLSENEIQKRITAQLPKEHRGVTVQQVHIELSDGELTALVTMEGKKGGQTFDLVISMRGTPVYESRDGEFFFKPRDVQVREFHFRGEKPSELVARLATRYLTNRGAQRLAADVAPKVDAWISESAERTAMFVLTRMPVYRLKDDGKGYIIKSSLESISVTSEGVSITFSLWQLTISVGIILLFVLAAIGLMIAMTNNPGLFVAGEAIGAVASVFD